MIQFKSKGKGEERKKNFDSGLLMYLFQSHNCIQINKYKTNKDHHQNVLERKTVIYIYNMSTFIEKCIITTSRKVFLIKNF